MCSYLVLMQQDMHSGFIHGSRIPCIFSCCPELDGYGTVSNYLTLRGRARASVGLGRLPRLPAVQGKHRKMSTLKSIHRRSQRQAMLARRLPHHEYYIIKERSLRLYPSIMAAVKIRYTGIMACLLPRW
jgi:hypothetical protein